MTTFWKAVAACAAIGFTIGACQELRTVPARRDAADFQKAMKRAIADDPLRRRPASSPNR